MVNFMIRDAQNCRVECASAICIKEPVDARCLKTLDKSNSLGVFGALACSLVGDLGIGPVNDYNPMDDCNAVFVVEDDRRRPMLDVTIKGGWCHDEHL
jgi:hypothetical protein